jgi:hypothetical protein
VWIKYRHLSYDDNSTGLTAESFQDFQYVGMGGLINF